MFSKGVIIVEKDKIFGEKCVYTIYDSNYRLPFKKSSFSASKASVKE
jgi:hypothetical protein